MTDDVETSTERHERKLEFRMSPKNRSDAIDLISRIKDERAGLRPAERRVADAILSDVEHAISATASELAALAGVSEPTVTRLCRALGFDGVRDFKLKLAQSLIVGTMYFREPPQATETSLPFAEEVLQHARGALASVERQLNDVEVNRAIKEIASAGKVLVFGVGGGSTAIAQDMQYRLFRYGISVTAYSDVYLMRMVASTCHAGDVIVTVSATGRTSEVLETAELGRQYGARHIALTAPHSPLAKAADIALTVEIAETSNVLKPTASRYAFMVLVDLIATGCAYTLGKAAQENLRRIKYNLLNHREGQVLEPLGD